ncbi:ABC transporter, permease protein 1 (cluster 4, leucine/isoleucine/valine/benzoate) [Olavius sp. associated proteobacterium Delta 1]|nr:ABC transporter, permease protein 1 (cluster 4, leucine/isoleucine/valine/benzoate) [Olavius sp. associated proteobacterium Delta 1]
MNLEAASVDLGAKSGLDAKTWAIRIASIGIWFLPLIWIDLTTYIVLTTAGLAFGMLLFMVAAGMTIIFGLMDVLNMAHGALFALGAYSGGYWILNLLEQFGWVAYGTAGQSLISLLLAILAGALAGALLGILVERIIIRGVYGDHLKQIMITMGVLYVMTEVIKIVWGANPEVVLVPMMFQGSFDIFDVIIGKFRVVAIIVGVIMFGTIQLILLKTKLGLIVRAGVENREAVQAAGYNINRIFTGVFTCGAALAGIGGTMWCIFQEQVYPEIGLENIIFAMIVVIIGGLGSVTGSFLGAIIVGLSFNYVSFLLPKLALGINILIMAIILLIRPWGLLGRE